MVDLVDNLKKDHLNCWLSPSQWRKTTVPTTLRWNAVRFNKSEATAVPNVRGVYAFLITFSRAGFPPHGYIVYIGETGSLGQETLHSRFLTYFREMDKETRAVHYVLKKYRSHMYFHFSEIPDKRRDLKKLESALCDTLVPPYNVRDFSAEMKKAVRAL
jgi:hypothetical protein